MKNARANSRTHADPISQWMIVSCGIVGVILVIWMKHTLDAIPYHAQRHSFGLRKIEYILAAELIHAGMVYSALCLAGGVFLIIRNTSGRWHWISALVAGLALASAMIFVKTLVG